MGQLFAVEVIYRGVFQKTLAKNITRSIVLAAHNEGKLGTSFGRYGDAPERNGIPAKSFAIVAKDQETLEAGMAQYEPKQVDLTEDSEDEHDRQQCSGQDHDEPDRPPERLGEPVIGVRNRVKVGSHDRPLLSLIDIIEKR